MEMILQNKDNIVIMSPKGYTDDKGSKDSTKETKISLR
jgi:hypothetical protein